MLGENQHLISLFYFICVWSALVGVVLERFLHAAVFFIASSLVTAGGGSNSLKRFASMEVIKESLSGIFDSIQGFFLAAGTFSVTVVTSWFFILTTLLIVFFVACLQHESSELIISYIRIYNSEISTVLRQTFLLTLQYGERFMQPVLLLWNSWWYLWKLMGSEVLLPLLMSSSGHVEKLAASVGLFSRSITLPLVSYVSRLQQSDCSIDRILSSAQMQNGTLPCFVPGRRSFDLITPMGDFRLVVMYLV